MGRDRAAYMREYRAQKKEDKRLLLDQMVPQLFARDDARIAELEEEVRHLKEELAKRNVIVIPDPPQPGVYGVIRSNTPERGYNTRPFTPVPKKGHG